MKQDSWEECITTNFSIKVTPNKAKAKVLLETAIGRNEFLQENSLKESNANYIFEGYYSSSLEMLHALVLLEGYKVLNHICIGYYIKDVLNDQKLFRLFDDCRFKRNSLIYYGKTMDFDVAQDAIFKCKEMCEKVWKNKKENIGKITIIKWQHTKDLH